MRVWLYVRDNWRPLSAAILLALAVGLNLAGDDRAIAAIAAATFSLVIMVWHFQQRIATPVVVEGGMQEAKPIILNSLKKLARFHTRFNPLRVRVIGCRLRDIRSVLDSLADSAPSNVAFSIFHVEPEFLTGRPWQSAGADLDDLQGSLRRIDALSNRLAARRVTFEFCGYRNRPILWCYEIGGRILIFGFFMWDFDEHTYKGPKNPGLVLRVGDPGFDEVCQWIGSLCQEWSSMSGNEKEGHPAHR